MPGIGEVGSGRGGMLRVMSNDQLVKAEREAQELREEQEQSAFVETLGTIIDDAWQRNKSYRDTLNIETEMTESLRQRRGEYDATKKAQLSLANAPEIFMGVTDVKCRAAEAWIFDVLGSLTDKSWGLKPTPVPDLHPQVREIVIRKTMLEWQKRLVTAPETQQMGAEEAYDTAVQIREAVEKEIYQEAQIRAEKMEKKIADIFVEGGWQKAFDQFIYDIVTFKVACIKGPIRRRVNQLKHVKDKSGRTRVRAGRVEKLCFERVSPLDCYPSPGSTSPNEGDFLERMVLYRADLEDMIGVEGWDADAIRTVLANFDSAETQGWLNFQQDRADLETKGSEAEQRHETIEGLEFWGKRSGKFLLELNKGKLVDSDGDPIDGNKEYDINGIKVGPYVVYRRSNPDPLNRRPYLTTSYERVAGSFWGKPPTELMSPVQNVCNASIRALVYNMSMASGPQVTIPDINRLPPGFDIQKVHPWKVWPGSNKAQSNLPVVQFTDIASHAQELMGVYNEFAKMADLFTGIPAYTHGNEQIAGAGRTYGGLSMLMGAAARGIKKVIAQISMDVIQEAVQRTFDWLMAYDPDESIKGDVTIVALGPLAVIMQEQMSQRRLAFLQATANPIDQTLVPLHGRANVLRAEAKGLDIPVDEVVVTRDEVTKLEEQQKQATEVRNMLALEQARGGGGIGEAGVRQR